MDIDIDFKNRDDALKHLKHIKGSIHNKENELEPHNTAVYFQNIPIDPITGISVFPYNNEYQKNYFKVDFLNLPSVYEGVESEKHLERLMNQEPLWEMFEDWEIFQNLFQMGSERTFQIIKKNTPTNIHELAMFLALIRPPMKHLIGKSWDKIESEIWNITEEQKEKGAFRKAHAYSYAMALIVQMNRIKEESLKNFVDN